MSSSPLRDVSNQDHTVWMPPSSLITPKASSHHAEGSRRCATAKSASRSKLMAMGRTRGKRRERMVSTSQRTGLSKIPTTFTEAELEAALAKLSQGGDPELVRLAEQHYITKGHSHDGLVQLLVRQRASLDAMQQRLAGAEAIVHAERQRADAASERQSSMEAQLERQRRALAAQVERQTQAVVEENQEAQQRAQQAEADLRALKEQLPRIAAKHERAAQLVHRQARQIQADAESAHRDAASWQKRARQAESAVHTLTQENAQLRQLVERLQHMVTTSEALSGNESNGDMDDDYAYVVHVRGDDDELEVDPYTGVQ